MNVVPLHFLQALLHYCRKKALDGAVIQKLWRLFYFQLQVHFDTVALVCPDEVAGVIE
jgi:hypothetical protein